ncbi:hypothetical protein [Haliea sp. E17]|uniref:hypothetical protein n=1 Tax=Haliea sp. E17 TaxID=3401576 RepID=UPI003AAAECB6
MKDLQKPLSTEGANPPAVSLADRGDDGDFTELKRHLKGFFLGHEEVFLLIRPADIASKGQLQQLLQQIAQSAPVVILDAMDLSETSLFQRTFQAFDAAECPSNFDAKLKLLGSILSSYERAFLIIENAEELDTASLYDLKTLSYLRTGQGPRLQFILLGDDTLPQKIAECPMSKNHLWRISQYNLNLSASRSIGSLKHHDSVDCAQNNLESAQEEQVNDHKPTKKNVPLPDNSSTSDPAGQNDLVENADKHATYLPPKILQDSYFLELKRSSSNPGVSDENSSSERTQLDSSFKGAKRRLNALTNNLPASLLHWRTPVFWFALPIVMLVAFWAGKQFGGSAVKESPVLELDHPAGNTGLTTPSLPPNVSIDILKGTAAPPGSTASTAKNSSHADNLASANLNETDDSSAVESTENIVAGRSVSTVIPETNAASTNLPEADESKKSQELKQRIDLLLAAGNASLDRDHLLTPFEVSAWKYYQQVMQIDPGNAAAEQGIKDIVSRYGWLVMDAIKRKDFDNAQLLLDRGLRISDRDPLLTALQKELDTELNPGSERTAADSLE